MARSVRFIHSGDLHLGAPFRGLRSLSAAWAERLTDAIPEAYDRLIETSIQKRVDFVLLAGDIFDTDTVSYAHHRRFLQGLQRLTDEGIPAYIIAGNHDPFSSWAKIIPDLPDGIHFMPSDAPAYEVFTKDGEPLAYICARGFTNAPRDNDIAQGITRQAAQNTTGVDAPFAIGMLHTGYTIDTRKAPCQDSTLLSSGMDYWAFGHIHQSLLFPPENPRWAYCGCIQGRDVKETGSRGCLEVTLTEYEPNHITFIPLASVEWERLEIPVDTAVSLSDIVSRCIAEMFDRNRETSCEEMVVRIVLTGQTPLHSQLAQPVFLEELRVAINEGVPAFYCDSIRDATTTPRSEEVLRDSSRFEGLVYEASDTLAHNLPLCTHYIQQCCTQKGIESPSLSGIQMQELIAQARECAFDALGETYHV